MIGGNNLVKKIDIDIILIQMLKSHLFYKYITYNITV